MNDDSDTSTRTTASASPLLTSFWTVGFTGHRDLGSQASVSERIREVLGEIPNRVSGQLVALSSLARGADLLFVEQALAVALPWLTILPMPVRCFFNETDFPDARERESAKSLLQKALAVEVTATPVSPEEALDAGWRESAFDDAGFRIVDDADILIAVIRRGEPPRGPGGTADMVRYAAERKRPCVLIDPDTEEVEWRDFPKSLFDPMMGELLALRKAPGPFQPLAEKSGDESCQGIAEFFSTIDAAALRKVPFVRNSSGVAVILHTAAMIVAAFALTLLASGVVGDKNPAFMAYATWIKATLVAIGFVTLVWITFFKPQATAARYRLAAEFLRSVLATWDFPRPLSALYRTPLREFRHFCRSLLIFRLVAQASSRRGAPPAFAKHEDFATFRSGYLSARIRPQLAYYREKLQRAHPKSHWSELLAFAFSAVALTCTIWLAFTIHRNSGTELLGLTRHEKHHVSRAWLEFGMVAAPVLASLFVAIISVFEWKRREARYTEIIAVLVEAEHKIRHTMNSEILEQVVVDTERELVAENVEWYFMARSASSV